MAALLGDIQSGLGQSKLKKVNRAPTSSSDAGVGGGGGSSATIASRRGFSLESGDPEEILKYQRYVLDFNIERWLDRLADDTFATTTLNFSPDVARELVVRYEELKERKETARAFLPDGDMILYGMLQGGDLDEGGGFPGLHELSTRLEGAIGDQGAFVKTSSRSAKDFADLATLKREYDSCLEQLVNSGVGGEQASENSALVAMSYASMSLLNTAKSSPFGSASINVINTLCQSERIWHDMQLATAAQGGEAGAEAEAGSEGVPAGPAGEGSATSHWEESLVVRSWVNIEPDMEFRCFVAGGKMTAISQYRHLIHFPRLCANWSEGEGASFMQALVDAFESGIRAKLEGCFSNDDYILDLAIELAPSQTIANILSSEALSPDVVQKVWVVEANPFFETTDGCLFSWARDLDQVLGLDEATRLEGRITTAPKKGASSLIYEDWRRLMEGEDLAIPGPDLNANHRVGGGGKA